MAGTINHDTERSERPATGSDVPGDTPRPGNALVASRVAPSAMSDSTGLYLNEIGKVPLLTADEEKELLRTIQAGRGRRLASTPVRKAATCTGPWPPPRPPRTASSGHLWLVVSIARKYPLPRRAWTSSTSSRRATSASSSRRQVRLAAGLQVLHLRHVLDPPGHRPGPRPEGQPGPAARRPLGRLRQRCASRGDGEELDPRTPGCTGSPRRCRSTAPSATTATPPSSTSAQRSLPSPEQAVMNRADDELVAELLGTLDYRARTPSKARFGLDRRRARATGRWAKSSVSRRSGPPRS